MHRQHIIAAVLLVLIGVALVATGYAKGWGPLWVVTERASWLANAGDERIVGPDDLNNETKSAVAPEISGGIWINSDPLTLTGLRGRVVIVEFWTFGCYNC